MQTYANPAIARSAVAVALASALLATQPLQAQAHGSDGPGADSAESSWGVGVIAMPEKKPYRDFDNKTEVLPFFTYENRWVRVAGPGVELKLGQDGPVRWGLTASYSGDGYKAKDSPYLSGMADRKGSLWLGARAGLHTELATFSAEWSADASGKSSGQKLQLGIDRRFSWGALGLTPRLRATWLDSNYVNYYYGVEASEARAGRSAYSAGSAVNTELGIRLDYRLAPQHMVFADVGATALGAAIKNSPVVARRSVPEVRVGYLYRF